MFWLITMLLTTGHVQLIVNGIQSLCTLTIEHGQMFANACNSQ